MMLLHCCSRTTATAATTTTLANHNKYNNKVSAQQIARQGRQTDRQAARQGGRQGWGRHQVSAEVLEVLIKCGSKLGVGSVSMGREGGRGRRGGVARGADNQIDMSCRRCRATRAASSSTGAMDLIYTRRKVHLT